MIEISSINETSAAAAGVVKQNPSQTSFKNKPSRHNLDDVREPESLTEQAILSHDHTMNAIVAILPDDIDNQCEALPRFAMDSMCAASSQFSNFFKSEHLDGLRKFFCLGDTETSNCNKLIDERRDGVEPDIAKDDKAMSLECAGNEVDGTIAKLREELQEDEARVKESREKAEQIATKLIAEQKAAEAEANASVREEDDAGLLKDESDKAVVPAAVQMEAAQIDAERETDATRVLMIKELKKEQKQSQAKKIADEKAAKKAEKKKEIEKKARARAEQKALKRRRAKKAAEKKVEEALLAKEVSEKKLEEKRIAKEAAAQKAEEDRIAKEASDKKLEEERVAEEVLKVKLEEERIIARLHQEVRVAEAERLAEEQRLIEMEQKRLAALEEERLAKKLEEEGLAKKLEEERLAKKLEEERLTKKLEEERLAKEAAEEEEKKRLAKLEEERLAKEKERLRKLKAKEEREARIAKLVQERAEELAKVEMAIRAVGEKLQQIEELEKDNESKSESNDDKMRKETLNISLSDLEYLNQKAKVVLEKPKPKTPEEELAEMNQKANKLFKR